MDFSFMKGETHFQFQSCTIIVNVLMIFANVSPQHSAQHAA